MNSLLIPDKLNANYSSVKLDVKLQAKSLWKLQFCVSLDNNGLTKWKVTLPDCVHVTQ